MFRIFTRLEIIVLLADISFSVTTLRRVNYIIKIKFET